MKLSRICLAGLILVMALSVLSCGGKSDSVLAEFKDKKITVADFEDAYANVDAKYIPQEPGVEGYKELLNTMLNRAVMAYKADELGYDKNQGVVQGLEMFETMGLQAAYLKIQVADKVEVSEDQIKEHYRNQGVTLTIKQILCDTPAEAEEVYNLLEDGANFESICQQHSKGPDAEEGGKVLTVAYGAYGPKLQRAMFSLPVGGITEPLETAYGFFIIKVLKREEAKRKDAFEDIRERIETEVKRHNEMIYTNQVTDGIRERANVVWFWENFRIIYDALPPDRPLTNPPSRKDEVYPLLYFEEKDLDMPLVSYKDKIITVKDFSDLYDRSSFFTRPRREYRFAGVKSFLMERIMNELVPEEMKRSKIKEHPEVVRVLESKREELMVNQLYEEMINKQTVVTEQMIQNYFNDNEQFFEVPEKRRFGVILTGDLDSAQKAYSEIQDGTRFRTVATAYSIDQQTLANMAETELLTNGEQPEIDRVGFALDRVGAVSEPFETSRGWMILKLNEKTASRRYSLEEAKDGVTGALKQLENEKRLNTLLEKWKEELNVTIHEENFGKINVEERTVPAAAGKRPGR